jgi:hypothetical protein
VLSAIDMFLAGCIGLLTLDVFLFMLFRAQRRFAWKRRRR